MTPRGSTLLVALAALLAPTLASANSCAEVLAALADRIETSDADCFESTDLTTNNPATTPANNAIAALPALAFTPITDRGVISPPVADKTPITKTVPGIQLDARLRSDPTGEARFLLRLPHDWNGRLVVAGASGTRSEFNGDWAWSDYVLQQGYAYASQNKGVLNVRLVGVSTTPPAGDPLACRLNPTSTVWVHFYDNDPEKPFTEWQDRIVEAGWIAKAGVKAFYGFTPRRTYAVGTSNGGYQVRRAIEEAPEVFDGGIDWEGTYVSPSADNILGTLPAAIDNWPAYEASGFDPSSAAAQAIRAAGYPPDIVENGASLWGNYSSQFWEVTACQWQKRLDPTYDTYGAGLGNYDYAARAQTTEVAANLAAFATTGKIKRPLITVAGTMDALLPIQTQARPYAAAVAASRKGNGEHREAQYRLYEVQNGNHIETYRGTAAGQFSKLEYLQPHAQRAFDLLVAHVEGKAPLPPDQCIPRGGAISAAPSQPGHCAQLYVNTP